MTDEITERVLNNESADADDDDDGEVPGYTGTFSTKRTLTVFGITIGIWTLIAIIAGWNKQLPAIGLSPGITLIVTVWILAFVILIGEARRLPLIPDLRDGLWDIVLFWSVMTLGAGILATIILWGPPDFAELLREVGT